MRPEKRASLNLFLSARTPIQTESKSGEVSILFEQCPRSLIGESEGLLIQRLQARILPGVLLHLEQVNEQPTLKLEGVLNVQTRDTSRNRNPLQDYSPQTEIKAISKILSRVFLTILECLALPWVTERQYSNAHPTKGKTGYDSFYAC